MRPWRSVGRSKCIWLIGYYFGTTGCFPSARFPFSLPLLMDMGGSCHILFEPTSLPLEVSLSSRGFPVRCCIVVKHLKRSELGTGDSPSQSPPNKRPCPDVQVSLVLLCPPLHSNCLAFFAQEVPDVLLCFLIIMLRIWEQS